MQHASYARILRLHSLAGFWLLFWPCLWALLYGESRDVLLFLVFFLGALCTRSLGCVINDLWDVPIDSQVERTKERPLAAGTLSRLSAVLLAALLALCCVALLFALPPGAVLVGAVLAPLIVIYPLAKRFFPLPQLVLALVFNGGVLMAFVAIEGALSWHAWVLYGAALFWTLGYDTIYAHQDARDDKRLKVHSAALLFGASTKWWVSGFYVLTMSAFLCLGAMKGASWGYYFWCFCFALGLFGHVFFVVLSVSDSCRRAFLSNAWLGIFPALAMLCL